MKNSTKEAVHNYINGNRGDFSRWLKGASKLEFMYGLEYFTNISSSVEDRKLFLHNVKTFLEVK